MTCRNCGNEHQDNFCPSCGEKKFDENSLSLKHFLSEAFEGITHFDNKFFRTTRVLLFKPGQLAIDFTEGRRVKYMKPFQLFLITNILFFFLLIGNPFSLPLQSYTSFEPYVSFNTVDLVNSKLSSRGMSYKEFENHFDHEIKAASKEFIFLFIPFYALIFSLVFFVRKRRFVENLVFASHFVTVILIIFFSLTYLVGLPREIISGGAYSQSFDSYFGLLAEILLFAYLFIAMSKFYGTHWTWNLIVAAPVAFLFFGYLQYYRMLLFYLLVH